MPRWSKRFFLVSKCGLFKRGYKQIFLIVLSLDGISSIIKILFEQSILERGALLYKYILYVCFVGKKFFKRQTFSPSSINYILYVCFVVINFIKKRNVLFYKKYTRYNKTMRGPLSSTHTKDSSKYWLSFLENWWFEKTIFQ